MEPLDKQVTLLNMKAVTKIEVCNLAPKNVLRITEVPGAPVLENGDVLEVSADLGQKLIETHGMHLKYHVTKAGRPVYGEKENDTPVITKAPKKAEVKEPADAPKSAKPVETKAVTGSSKAGKPNNKNMEGAAEEKAAE